MLAHALIVSLSVDPCGVCSMLEEMNKMNDENEKLRAEKNNLMSRMQLSETAPKTKGASSRSPVRLSQLDYDKSICVLCSKVGGADDYLTYRQHVFYRTFTFSQMD